MLTRPLLLLIGVVALKSISDFRGNLFNRVDSGYYDVYIGDLNQGTSSTHPGNRLTSLIDLNNDKRTDLVTVDDQGAAIRVYLYDESDAEFKYKCSTILPDQCVAQSVTFMDISDDGTVEMLISLVCQKTTYKMVVYEQKEGTNPDGSTSMFSRMSGIDDILVLDGSQPLLADLNGDFRTDIMFTDPQKQKKVALMDGNNPPQIIQFEDMTIGSTSSFPGCQDSDATLPLSVPHSSAFADVDGDCASDLILFTKTSSSVQLEIWISIPSQRKFCLVQKKQISSNEYTQFAISDLNQDGAVDLFYIGGVSKTLKIYYNKRIPGTTSLCTIESVAKNGFLIYETNTEGHDYVRVNDFFSYGETMFTQNANYPFTIRVGDVNLDSYPEILVTLYKGGSKTSWIYFNSQCAAPSDTSQRCFTVDNRILGDRFQNSEYATFFDLDENGEVDILYGVKNNGHYEIKAIYNNQLSDAFFLKTFTIRQKGKYGDVIYGANYRFVKTQSFSTNIVLGGTQLSQSSYQALQMPYCLFGIGRSKDYIKQFKVALVADGDTRIKNYSPIIPNSQLIITAKNSNTAQWILELFINPTDKIWLICIIIACFLIILFTVVLIMQIREYKKDQRDNYVGKLY